MQNESIQDHSEEAVDVNNNQYLNDPNFQIEGDVVPSPDQFNQGMNNINIPDDIYNNDINELDVDINDHNLDDAQSQEDPLNNQDIDNENENENNFNNEEQEDFEQEEMNDNEGNEGNEINELNLNVEKDMNYMADDNNNQENALNNMNEFEENNLQGNFDENNIDDNDINNANLENMIDMQQNEAMINDNNNLNNMNQINNEDNFNNDNNNFESSDMENDLNNNNMNMNNMNNMNFMYNKNLKKKNMNNNINPLNIEPNINMNQGFDAGYGQEDDEGFNNPEMNNINNNMLNNNENNIENQQLMEHIEEINGRFFDLEKEFKFLEKQNKELKKELKFEKMKNREMKPNDFLIYDNTLKQGKLFLEDQKKKNSELKKIINDLEEQKKVSDYKLIEANQKIKRLEKDYNIINNNQKEENKNNNNIQEQNNNNNDNEIITLKNKIDEYEIANSKLVLDNENLKKKMESMEKEYKNQMKIFVQYKNSEIKTYHNTISQYKEYFKNHKINPSNKKQTNNEENNNSNKNNNNNLDYGTIMVEMSNKDNLIKSLNSKLDKYMNEYKDIIGEKQSVQQQCNEMQFANQKLMNENNDLKEKNENLKMELANLNQKVKMNKIKYKNNEYIFNQNITQMKEKLVDYKQRIIMLKTKIKELIGDNQPKKPLNQQNNNNYAKEQNFNNFLDIKQIPLTPTQKKKFSGMSHGKTRLNKMQGKNQNFGANDFYYNKMKNINNNF